MSSFLMLETGINQLTNQHPVAVSNYTLLVGLQKSIHCHRMVNLHF